MGAGAPAQAAPSSYATATPTVPQRAPVTGKPAWAQ